MDLPVLAVDIGGTKMAAGLVSAAGEVDGVRLCPTNGRDPVAGEQVWTALLGLLQSVQGEAEICGVAVGSCGPMDKGRGELSPLNIPAWRSFPLVARLRETYPGLPVRLLNDGVVFAVGEHWMGAGRGATDMVGLVVSTGVGGGLVLDGSVMDGPSGNAGHLGHMVVDPEGLACGCGGRGCVESIASGPALLAWAKSQGWVAPPGEADSARTLAAMAASGDPLSRSALSRSGRAVGVAIASIAHLLDVTTFVVGGGLSHAGDLLFEPMRTAAKEHACLAFAADLQIVPSGLGVEAALIGAAAAILRPDYWGSA